MMPKIGVVRENFLFNVESGEWKVEFLVLRVEC